VRVVFWFLRHRWYDIIPEDSLIVRNPERGSDKPDSTKDVSISLVAVLKDLERGLKNLTLTKVEGSNEVLKNENHLS
jgi:hypothetical protein